MAQQKAQGTITIIDTTDINSIKNWYLATNASSGVNKTTTGWTDTVQQMSASKQYLWNYEQILGSGNVEISSTQPVIIGHYGINGQNGADGNSIVSITEYYQVTNSTTNPGASGWQTTLVVPTSTNKYLWNYQVINYSKTAAEGSYSDARIIGVYGDKGETGDTGPQGPQGPQGNAGINTATVYLYQRATSAPTKPSGNLTYTFASSSITSGTLGNWKQSIGELTGTNPIWVIAAVASSNGATDVIASSEWSTQIKLAQDGTNGTNGTDGLNQATVFIYIRASSAVTPSPATTTYTFSTGSFTAPTNWSKTIPASNGNPCYVSSAVAIGNGTTATLTWNTPSILVEDGNDGISPTVTSTSNGVKIVDADGNETYITNGTNGTSYYTHIRYADDSSGTNMSSSPTNKTYIGIYSGTSSTAPTTANSYIWSKYVGDNGGQGPQGVSVTGVRELYYLKTNSTNPSTITSSSQITATDRQNGWTSVIPTFVNNGVYYTCTETTLSSGGPIWSAPSENKGLTSANQKALDAYNTSTARDTEINALQAQAKHYWWDNQGAHVAAGANTTNVNNITQGTPDTYGFNSLMAPGYLSLKHKDIDFAVLATNSLTFYRPATDSSNNYVQGKKGMDLTADALTFYKPLAYNSANEPTAAATLNANGLVLSEGGIKAGTSRTNGFIYLSSANFADTISGHTAGTVSLDNYTATDWRQLIGTKFGVRADGTLYANNAVISGTITVGSGSDLSAGLGDYSTTSQTQSYITGLGYQTSNDVNTIIGQTNVSDLSDGSDYTKTTNLGNTTAVQNAAKTASNYLGDTDSNAGVTLKAQNGTTTANTSTSNYIKINTNGLEVFKAGISVALYGDTARIGKINSSRFLLNANSLQAYNSSNTKYFEVSPDGMTYGSNTVASTIYADGKASAAQAAAETTAQGYANTAEANASYSVEIQVTSIDYTNNSATLVAIPYYQGSTTLPTGVTLSYQWYKNGSALSNTSTAPTITGATTNTLQLGEGTDFGSSTTNAIYTCVIS